MSGFDDFIRQRLAGMVPMGLPGPSVPSSLPSPQPGAEQGAFAALMGQLIPGLSRSTGVGPVVAPSLPPVPQTGPQGPANPAALAGLLAAMQNLGGNQVPSAPKMPIANVPGNIGAAARKKQQQRDSGVPQVVIDYAGTAADMWGDLSDEQRKYAVEQAQQAQAQDATQRGVAQAVQDISAKEGNDPILGPVVGAVTDPVGTAKAVGSGAMTAAGFAQKENALQLADLAGKAATGDTTSGLIGQVEISAMGKEFAKYVPSGQNIFAWEQEHPDVVKQAYTQGYTVPGSGQQVSGMVPGTVVAGTEKTIKPGKEAVLAAYTDSLGGGVPGFLKDFVFSTLTDPTMLLPGVDEAGTALRGVGESIEAGGDAARAGQAARAAGIAGPVVGEGETVGTAARTIGKGLQGVGKGIEAAARVPDLPVAAAKGVGGVAIDAARTVPWIDRALTESAASKARALENARQSALGLLAKSQEARDRIASALGKSPADAVFADTSLGRDAGSAGKAVLTGAVAGDEIAKIGDYTIVKDPGGRFTVVGADGKPATGYFETEKQAAQEATHLLATKGPAQPSGLDAAQRLHADIDALMNTTIEPTDAQVKTVTDRAAALGGTVPSGPTTPFDRPPVGGTTPFDIPQPPDINEVLAAKQRLHQLGYTPEGVKVPELGYTPVGQTHFPAPGDPHVYPQIVEPLTPDEEQAVKAYVSFNYTNPKGEYSYLNIGQAVADPKVANVNPAETERLAAVLDSAISKGVFPEKTTLYRGVSHPEYDKIPTEIGDVYTQDRYVSTTHSLTTAKSFGMNGTTPTGEPHTILQFNVPAGMPGLNHPNMLNGEKEVILPRQTAWQVTGIDGMDGGRFRLVTLDPVSPTGAGITPPGFATPPLPDLGKPIGVVKDGVPVAVGDPITTAWGGKGTVIGPGHGVDGVYANIEGGNPQNLYPSEYSLLPTEGTTPFGETSIAAAPSTGSAPKAGSGQPIAVGDTVKTTYGGSYDGATVTKVTPDLIHAKLTTGDTVAFYPSEITEVVPRSTPPEDLAAMMAMTNRPPSVPSSSDIPMSLSGKPIAVGDKVQHDATGLNGHVTELLGDGGFGHKVQVAYDNGTVGSAYADELHHPVSPSAHLKVGTPVKMPIGDGEVVGPYDWYSHSYNVKTADGTVHAIDASYLEGIAKASATPKSLSGKTINVDDYVQHASGENGIVTKVVGDRVEMTARDGTIISDQPNDFMHHTTPAPAAYAKAAPAGAMHQTSQDFQNAIASLTPPPTAPDEFFHGDKVKVLSGYKEGQTAKIAGMAGKHVKLVGEDGSTWSAEKANIAKITEEASRATPPFPAKLDDVEHVKTLGGSTGGGAKQVEWDGKQFVKKIGNSNGHIVAEATADDVYRLVGADVPATRLYTRPDGTSVKLAELVPGKHLDDLTGAARDAAEEKLRQHFAVDALLGNWDVAGLNADNIVVDEAGNVRRVDNGGSFSYRAQGKRKAVKDWGGTVGELDTMRDPAKNASAGKIFESVTDGDIVDQIDTQITPNRQALTDLVSHSKLSPADQATFTKRLDYLEQWADDHRTVPAPGIVAPPPPSTASPFDKFDVGRPASPPVGSLPGDRPPATGGIPGSPGELGATPTPTPTPTPATAATGAPSSFPEDMARILKPGAANKTGRLIDEVGNLAAQGDPRVQAFLDDYAPKFRETYFGRPGDPRGSIADWDARTAQQTSHLTSLADATPAQRAVWFQPNGDLTPEGIAESARRKLGVESWQSRQLKVRDYVDQVESWRKAGLPGDPPSYQPDFPGPGTGGLDQNFVDVSRSDLGKIQNRKDIRDVWKRAPADRPDIRNLFEVAVTTPDDQLATDIRYAMRSSPYGQWRRMADDAKDLRGRLYGAANVAADAEERATSDLASGLIPAKVPDAAPPAHDAIRATPQETGVGGFTIAQRPIGPEAPRGGLTTAFRQGDVNGDYRLFVQGVRNEDVFARAPEGKVLFDKPLADKGDQRYLGDIFLDNLEKHAKGETALTEQQIVAAATKDTMDAVAPKASAQWRLTAKNAWQLPFRSLYDAYLAVGRTAKGIQQFSWMNAPRRMVSETLGNQWMLAMHGETDAIARSMDLGANGVLRAAYRDTARATERGLSEGPVGEISRAFGLAPREADVTVGERIGKEDLSRQPADATTFGRKFGRGVAKVAGFAPSDTAKRLVATSETTSRAALHVSTFMREIDPLRDAFRTQVADLAAKRGVAGDELIGNLGEMFSPQDVRTFGTRVGLNQGDTERLARDWRSAITDADKVATDRTNKLFFTYRTTNADEMIQKAFFYHYWATRAAPIYLEAAIRNPAVLATYAHLLDAVGRDCERREGQRCGYVQALSTAGGMTSYFNPLLAISTTLINFEPDFNNPNARMIDRVLAKTPAMLNPVLQAGLSITGLSSSELSDPLASYGPRRVWATAINAAKAHGLFGADGGIVNPTPEFWNRLVTASSDWFAEDGTWHQLPFARRVPLPDQNRSAKAIIDTRIIQLVYEKHGIDPTTDPLTLENDPTQQPVVDEITTAIAAADTGDWTNPLAGQAFREWSKGDVGRTGTAAFFGGTSLGSDALDQLRTVGYDKTQAGTPQQATALNTLQLVNAGGPAALKLGVEANQYHGVGTNKGQYATDLYNKIVNAGPDAVPDGIDVGGQTFSGQDIAKLPRDDKDPTYAPGMLTRKLLATQWLGELGLIPAQQAQYAAQDAFKADVGNADYANYATWESSARSIGMDELMKVSKAYRIYINGLPSDVKNDPSKLASAAFGQGAYLATQGERAKLSSDLTHDTFDISKANPIDILGKGGGSTAPQNTTKDPATQVVDDMQKYQVKMALFNQQLGLVTGNPNDRWDDNMNPQLKAAMTWKLNNAGISIPSLPQSVQNYQMWQAARQAMGMPSGLTDYAQWSSVVQAKISPYGYNLSDVMTWAAVNAASGLGTGDLFAGTGLANLVTAGQSGPFVGSSVANPATTQTPYATAAP